VTDTRRNSARNGTAMALAIAGALIAANPAEAHPHIWIDAAATLVFEQGALVGVETQWTLDPFVSALLIEDFDADKNGVFEPDEMSALEQATFVGLSEYGFYTHLRIDGVASSPEAVSDFLPTIRDDIVLFEFYVPLPAPVDPLRQSVDIAFYDDSYYTDLYVEDSTVSLRGDLAAGCAATVRLDEQTPIYYGVVFPTRIGISCAEG